MCICIAACTICLCRSDLTLVCSPVELQLLQAIYGIPKYKLCNASFFATAAGAIQPFSKRAHFMTIGTWRHPPNRDAVQWLYQHIWPAIRSQIQDAELHIYGAHMSAATQQYHKPVCCFARLKCSSCLCSLVTFAQLCS